MTEGCGWTSSVLRVGVTTIWHRPDFLNPSKDLKILNILLLGSLKVRKLFLRAVAVLGSISAALPSLLYVPPRLREERGLFPEQRLVIELMFF